MNPADPKWLETLKASGWQTSALTVACIVFLLLVNKGIIPTTNSPLWIALPSIGALVFGFLSLASISSAAAKYIKPGDRLDQWRLKRRRIKEVGSKIGVRLAYLKKSGSDLLIKKIGVRLAY